MSTVAVLRDVISEQAENWTSEQLDQVLMGSAPSAALRDIATVPSATWTGVIKAIRAVPTVENVWSYVQVNQFDQHLARFLAPDGNLPIELQEVDEAAAETRTSLAIEILNAPAQLLPAATRVQLVLNLNLTSKLEATALVPAGDHLLARALEAGLVSDTSATFAHFAQTVWKSVSEAFAVSKNMDAILTPSLVSGFVTELVAGTQVPQYVREKVVNDLELYVVDDDADALRPAGEYAREMKIWFHSRKFSALLESLKSRTWSCLS